MKRRRRFEELVALFAGPLLDQPDLDRSGASAEGRWPALAAVRSGGEPGANRVVGPVREDRAAAGAGAVTAAVGEAKCIC